MSQTVTETATTGTEPFPSIVIRADALVPQGSYAEAQAAFLKPDAETVERLTDLLRSRKIGVAAHFYMDPELQGVLTASDWPHIQISDSLAMADAAVEAWWRRGWRRWSFSVWTL